MSDYDSCSVCGCTDENPCLEEDGLPCAWLTPHLCTRCAAENNRPAEPVKIFTEAEAGRILRAMRTRG